MKPIIILPPNAMSDPNIKALRDNGICVVVAKEPALVKFVDPIPASSCRNSIESAAIALSRKILNPGFWSADSTRDLLTRTYMDILMKGTPLDQNPSKAEQEQRIFDQAKVDELCRLAREEAKSERLALKSKSKITPNETPKT